MFGNEKEAIQLIEKKISELQNIVSNLINNFEIYKSNSGKLIDIEHCKLNLL